MKNKARMDKDPDYWRDGIDKLDCILFSFSFPFDMCIDPYLMTGLEGLFLFCQQLNIYIDNDIQRLHTVQISA